MSKVGTSYGIIEGPYHFQSQTIKEKEKKKRVRYFSISISFCIGGAVKVKDIADGLVMLSDLQFDYITESLSIFQCGLYSPCFHLCLFLPSFFSTSVLLFRCFFLRFHSLSRWQVPLLCRLPIKPCSTFSALSFFVNCLIV